MARNAKKTSGTARPIAGDPVETVLAISAIREAVLDSCTLILLDKAGILDACARAIAFKSVGAVRVETGYPGGSVEFGSFASLESPETADAQVLAFARARKIPLASDDGKLLSRASPGTETLDSLDCALAAYMAGTMDDAGYASALKALSLLRPYPPRRLAVAAELFEAARKLR